jgi:hypothetical protein
VRVAKLITTSFEHIPADLLAHQMLAIASCHAAAPLIQNALSDGWMAAGVGLLEVSAEKQPWLPSQLTVLLNRADLYACGPRPKGSG